MAVDEWLMFDDENVSMVTSEDILKLSGGGPVCFIVFLNTLIALTRLNVYLLKQYSL